MATEAAFLRPTSISPARTSRREHAPEGEGAVSGHTPVAPQDDDYEYENVPTRGRFGIRFRELTTPDAPPPSGGVDPLRFVAWVLPPALVIGMLAWVIA